MILRHIVFVALAAAFFATGVGAVQAGGTWFEPSDVRIEAGETVELTATVNRGALGWIEDGPFFLYLHGETFGTATAEGLGGSATDVPLGELDTGTERQPLSVSATVTIPEETPPGEYWITVCNEPCTTGLGELIGALIYVGIDPPMSDAVVAPVVATTAAAALAEPTGSELDKLPTVKLALAPYPDRTDDMSPLWVGISAALAGAVLLAALLVRQRDDGDPVAKRPYRHD